MPDKIEDQSCQVPGCDVKAAVHVPAVLAQDLLDASAAELVVLCAAHAEEANAPERPTN